MNGLRVGLSPGRILLEPKETALKVRLHYENVGREPRKVPVHDDPAINCFRILFAIQPSHS